MAARRARVRRLIRVYVHVSLDRTRLRESLLADGALVAAFPRVDLSMPRQMTTAAELFLTLAANVDLQACRRDLRRPVWLRGFLVQKVITALFFDQRRLTRMLAEVAGSGKPSVAGGAIDRRRLYALTAV